MGKPTKNYLTEEMVIDVKSKDPEFPFSVNINLYFPGMRGEPKAYLTTRPGIIFYPEEIDKIHETLNSVESELYEIKKEAEKRFPGIEVVL
jgi:hypothetical protein